MTFRIRKVKRLRARALKCSTAEDGRRHTLGEKTAEALSLLFPPALVAK